MSSRGQDQDRPVLRRPSDLLAEPRRVARRRFAGDATSWPKGFASDREDRDALLILSGLPSMTAGRLLELAADRPTAMACLAAVRDGSAGSEGDRARAVVSDAEAIRSALEQVGGRLVAIGDADYPPSLLDLFDPPAAIFVRGSWPNGGRVVAVVVARNCSAAGREMARTLGRRLCGAGIAVISGAARGIDAAAHQGALDVGGATIAVLGCGIDIAYPRGNRDLLERIAALASVADGRSGMGSGGAIVSEYPPGIPAEPFRFPARNRVIAALAEAVVVVEGADGSGSMITAELALELGREVMAVPGAVTSELSQVPLALIREGAALIRGPQDLLDDLGLVAPPGGAAPDDEMGGVPRWTGERGAVMDAIGAGNPPDAIAAATGLSLPRVLAVLVGLEVHGVVRSVGGRYERTLGAAGAGRRVRERDGAS